MNYEFIKIEHEISNRIVYAEGLIKAAHWIMTKPIKIYQSEDMLADLLNKKNTT